MLRLRGAKLQRTHVRCAVAAGRRGHGTIRLGRQAPADSAQTRIISAVRAAVAAHQIGTAEWARTCYGGSVQGEHGGDGGVHTKRRVERAAELHPL